MKISIIGAGKVGSSIAFSLLHSVQPDELVLVDIVEPLVKAEELDLGHAAVSLSTKTKVVGSTTVLDAKDSDFIIITAGKARFSGSRQELYDSNKPIIESLCKQVSDISPKAVVLIVTNPSTQMAEVANKFCDNVIAMDNQLDTCRLRYNICKETNKNLDEIESCVFGEHGENMQFDIKEDLPDEQKVIEETKCAGAKIIKGKNHTCWGIASQVVEEIKKQLR